MFLRTEGLWMKQGATRLRKVPETAEEIAAMPARASADSAAATRAIPVNLMPLISAYRRRGRFMLRIENLPQAARFSAGQNNGDGSWSLALDELDELVYFVPKNATSGDHTLSIRLVAKDDTEAFTLALIDFPILGMGERESAGFPKPVEAGPSQDVLRAELQETQGKLAARDAELNQLRASAERMGVLLQQKLDQAVTEAEARWRREEPARFAAEKSKLEEQFDQRLAERESRVQAMADIAREQQAAQIRRLAQELGAVQETLASRDGELAASRAALERARAETESETKAARQSAQVKASEALKVAEAEWQTKAGKALAEMTARRDQAEAALAKAQAALAAADASGELQNLRSELEKLRLKAEADAAAKVQAEARTAEAVKAAEAAKAGELESQAQAAKLLADMTARAEAAEAGLSAVETTGPGHEAEIGRLRADLERQRFQLEMDLLSAKVALEEKAQDALKAAEAEWQASADEARTGLVARAERAEAELAEARAAAMPNADRDMALNQLRRELEHQRVKAQEEIAAALATAGVKAVETETALAEVTARAKAAEAALAKAPSATEQEIAANQLRRELEHQRVKAQSEIATAQSKQAELQQALAAMTARAEASEATLAKAPSSTEQEIAANQLRRELEHQRTKAQSELAVAHAALETRMTEAAAAKAEAARQLSEGEAEMTQLRAEFEQKGKAAESAIAALRMAAEKESAEKLKQAEARWQTEKATLMAEMAERAETAEATLARAKRLDAAKADDDAYVHSLEREVKSLRATLADREISLVQNQAMQDHLRLGTVRETPSSRWQPLMGQVGAEPEEKSAKEKSRQQLFRDVAIVVAVAAVAVLLLPRLEGMLPDTLRWQIETLGGTLIPSTTEVAAPPPQQAAAVQPKAEHPTMYVARAVNVRAEPSIGAPIAASLKRGAQVSVLEKRGNWDQVEIIPGALAASAQAPATQRGWVYSSYLTDTDPGSS